VCIFVCIAVAAFVAGADERPRVALCSPGNAKAGDVVALLEAGLVKSDKVVVIDRAHVEKFLAEQSLSVEGLVREPVVKGKLLGAGYVLSVSEADSASVPACGLLLVEIASGNVIFERVAPRSDLLALAEGNARAEKVLAEMLEAVKFSEQSRSKPSAVVAAVLNKGESSRLGFMEDSLRGMLETLLEQRGYRVLRRHHPGLLAGETALSSSGFVRPDVAVLAETGDLVLTISFAESPSLDKPFEKTPIHLDLEVKVKGGKAQRHQFVFTPEGVAELLPQMRKTIHDRAVSGAQVVQDDSLQRRIEAARLLASLKDAPASTLFLGSPEVERKQVEVAQRVIYLDPTARDAYYHLGRSMLSDIVQTCGWPDPDIVQSSGQLNVLKPGNWHDGKVATGSWKEVLEAYQGYLNFPRTNVRRVSESFRYILDVLPYVYSGQELVDRSFAALSDYYRWAHAMNPGGYKNNVLVPTCSRVVADYWVSHPEKQVEFYTWLDRLYGMKPGKTLRPGSKPDYNAGHADAAGESDPPVVPAVWNRPAIQTVVPKAVSLPDALGYSIAIRRTESGLWVQGMLAAQRMTVAQAKPGCYFHNMAVCRSTNGENWQVEEAPKEFICIQNDGSDGQANVVTSIAQAGPDVLFATRSSGLYVYNPTNGWRWIGLREGLPTINIEVSATAGDGKSVWFAGEEFLCQYRCGSIFLATNRVNRFCYSMAEAGGRIVTLGYGPDDLFAIDPGAGKIKTLFNEARQRREGLAVAGGEPVKNYFNAGDTFYRRLSVASDRLFYVSPYGLHVLDFKGKPLRYWWGGGACHKGNATVQVAGNCLLPPFPLREVIQDDRDPGRLWLISQTGNPGHDFRFPALDVQVDRNDDVNGQAYVTAYDWKRDVFSKPLRIGQACVVTAEAYGDYLYFTGDKLSRVAKSSWVLDQPGEATASADDLSP
jgi:hypothetical protein